MSGNPCDVTGHRTGKRCPKPAPVSQPQHPAGVPRVPSPAFVLSPLTSLHGGSLSISMALMITCFLMVLKSIFAAQTPLSKSTIYKDTLDVSEFLCCRTECTFSLTLNYSPLVFFSSGALDVTE